MRLYDQVASMHDAFSEYAHELLRESVYFNVSNVSKYLEHHTMQVADIPSAKPPFVHSWWETSVPTGLANRHGAAVEVTEWGNGHRYNISTEDYSDSVQGEMTDEMYWTVWPDGKIVKVRQEWTKGGLFHTPMFRIGIPLDHLGRLFLEDGKIVGRDLFSNPLLIDRQSEPRSYASILETSRGIEGFSIQHYRKGRVNHAMKYIWPFLVAIGFSHCRNVEMADAPEIPYKVRRKQELKLGAPLVSFKELIIDPNAVQKRVVNNVHDEDGEKRAKALHIARGNFAHYTEDRKLFGRYTGTFWRPAHVRGSAQSGTIYKDYKVNP